MSAICVVPARGGSRRIPRKNIRDFHGKPIIAYSIEAARQSGLFDGGIYVSTDDLEIYDMALALGAKGIPRPDELSEVGAPDCGTQEVTRHAIIEVKKTGAQIDYACCIYPCAPMLTEKELLYGFARASGDAPYAYVPGIYYWGATENFISGRPLSDGIEMVFPKERYIDINTFDDWHRAERMYEEIHRE